MVDSFTVSNVQPGTPLTFRATLSASLACSRQSNGCGACDAGITGPDGTTQSDRIEGCFGRGNSAAPLLNVTVQVPAGQTFGISYTVEAEANEGGYAQAGTQLAFQDLPPGASIQSCYGYRQDFPVPTKTMSWGRVKVLYR